MLGDKGLSLDRVNAVRKAVHVLHDCQCPVNKTATAGLTETA